MNKAVFLDKDGTLVDNSNYPFVIPSDKLLKNILKGLKLIQEKGYELFIVSNQPWISKKKLSIKEVDKIFKSIILQLNEKGILIKDYIYCPHSSKDNCDCKKPSSKMIKQLANKHNICLKESFTIGDMEKDILAGNNSGTKTILVLTGNGKKFKDYTKATYILKNLDEISKII